MSSRRFLSLPLVCGLIVSAAALDDPEPQDQVLAPREPLQICILNYPLFVWNLLDDPEDWRTVSLRGDQDERIYVERWTPETGEAGFDEDGYDFDSGLATVCLIPLDADSFFLAGNRLVPETPDQSLPVTKSSRVERWDLLFSADGVESKVESLLGLDSGIEEMVLAPDGRFLVLLTSEPSVLQLDLHEPWSQDSTPTTVRVLLDRATLRELDVASEPLEYQRPYRYSGAPSLELFQDRNRACVLLVHTRDRLVTRLRDTDRDGRFESTVTRPTRVAAVHGWFRRRSAR